MQSLVRGLAASAAFLAASALPALAADPCAGQLATASIIDCLKPGGDATTRGIRPAAVPPPSAATPAAARVPAPARATGPTVNLLVPFGYDSAELTPAGTKALDALGAALKDPALASARFEIGGHTDASGSADYNMKLSEKRAEAARAYLIEKAGVPAGRLTAVGFGRTQLYDASAPAAAVNRRVQVTRLD
jgi:outer membrane protein OmpA-like peptidoglycan-associated protein